MFLKRLKEYLHFTCNLCGRSNIVRDEKLNREDATCKGCGSNVRYRTISYIISQKLFSRDLSLNQIEKRKDIKGLSFSDCIALSNGLENIFDYKNTFYHKAPRLDILSISSEMEKKYDFLICSEVLEHVMPPVQTAFDNLYKMLRPGAFLVLTLPYSLDQETIEHYPDIKNFKSQLNNGKWVVEVEKMSGETYKDQEPIFHGGPGQTLELRLFSKSGIESNLKKAGFKHVEFFDWEIKNRGIVWRDKWSLPIIARA